MAACVPVSVFLRRDDIAALFKTEITPFYAHKLFDRRIFGPRTSMTAAAITVNTFIAWCKAHNRLDLLPRLDEHLRTRVYVPDENDQADQPEPARKITVKATGKPRQ